jgi:hypothetical protein
VLDLLSLGSLLIDFVSPFFAIVALATSITIRDLAISRDHLERVLPLILTAYRAVSIVPAAS